MKPTDPCCEVPWCLSFATTRGLCAIHAVRRVEPNEKQEDWMIRLRQEDATAKREAAKLAAEEAAKQRQPAYGRQ